MMTKKPCWVDSNNVPHFTREGCQGAELQILMKSEPELESGACGATRDSVSNWIVNNADAIVNILTTTEKSRPAARKANGGSKKRSNGVALRNVPAQADLVLQKDA